MPNNFFRFKEFTVQQENCAMKVCTDACLFGGLLPPGPLKGGWKVLDIGTGTGLLSLMYAQQNLTAEIDAVEIDKEAAKQAGENFLASPWSKRLHIYNEPIQEFAATKPSAYDFIFSNPPFFENDLKSPDAKRNVALHHDALSLEALLHAIKKLLKDEGQFAVLLPYHRTGYFTDLCSNMHFYPFKKVFVKQTTKHNYFRSMLWFNSINLNVAETSICIKDDTNEYTEAFTAVLRDYYLHL